MNKSKNEVNIEYRPIKRSDYDQLETIIKKVWEYEQFASPKIATRLSRVFLASCLVNQTYTCVAVRENEPVGIIMGKNRKKHHKPLKHLIHYWWAIAQTFIYKEGRQISKMYGEIDKINEALLKRTQTPFDGELALFVMDENQQGMGIGKTLYQNFLEYMSNEELNSFFLYTDTTCNFGFYEHQGLHRLEKEHLHFEALNEAEQFYLYSNINE